MTEFKPSIPKMKYHADDWNIVTKTEKETERISGLQFLSSSNFRGRCVEWFICEFPYFFNNRQNIDNLLKKQWFFVIASGLNIPKKFFLVNNSNNLLRELKKWSDFDKAEYVTLTFIKRLQACEGCCSGVVLSDGEGGLRIELMNNTVNTRDITDGSKESDLMIYLETLYSSLKLIHGQQNRYINTPHFQNVIFEIIRSCYHNAGYYEFIYGSNQRFSIPNLFFTYYSDNIKYGFDNKLNIKGYKL